MAQVFNKIYVDVRTKNDDIITAVQNDSNSRFLDVYLLDNGLPINLTGHEVRIYCKKADGKEIYNNGVITEATNGRCQFELTDQALAVAQDLEVQIVIYYNNVQILQAMPFQINVVKSLISSGSVESSNEYGALVVLYQNLYEAYDLMVDIAAGIKDIAVAVEGTTKFNNSIIEASTNLTDVKVLNISFAEVDILNITGTGFVSKLGVYPTSGNSIHVKVYIDDVILFNFTRTGTSYVEFGKAGANAMVDLTKLKNDSTPTFAAATSTIIRFAKKLRVVASSTTSNSDYVQIIYGLVG